MAREASGVVPDRCEVAARLARFGLGAARLGRLRPSPRPWAAAYVLLGRKGTVWDQRSAV
jgi:hypothetical protein